MNYPSPAAARRALKDHIAHHIRNVGGDAGQLHKLFYFRRLIARVFATDPDGWVLKGGQALLVRYSTARHSLDIDLYRANTADPEEAIRALTSAAETDLDDYLRFDLRRRLRPAGAQSNLIRLAFAVSFGGRDVDSVHVDVVVGAPPHGQTTTTPLEAPIAVDWPRQWPDVRLYPLVDHVSDKICAMYERHGDLDLASTRWRDLVDLLLIALHENLDGRALQQTLRTEQTRRRTRGIQVEFPSTFQVPDPVTWPAGYQQEAANVAELEQLRTLNDATPIANAFLNPVLGPNDPGQWIPAERTWYRAKN